jgi:hypothetical protein
MHFGMASSNHNAFSPISIEKESWLCTAGSDGMEPDIRASVKRELGSALLSLKSNARAS